MTHSPVETKIYNDTELNIDGELGGQQARRKKTVVDFENSGSEEEQRVDNFSS